MTLQKRKHLAASEDDRPGNDSPAGAMEEGGL
jgi:hypothetical protein